jgi:hypothetical protein
MAAQRVVAGKGTIAASGNLSSAPRFPAVPGPIPPFRLLTGLMLAGCLALPVPARAADKEPAAFGDAVQLAPFVVNGKKLTIAIHARNDPDRAYALKFAEEVVGIAYETMDGESTGSFWTWRPPGSSIRASSRSWVTSRRR